MRFENVDQDGFGSDANAATLDLILGYETAVWNDFQALIEFEGVSAIGNDTYNSTTNGETGRPVVADPEGEEVNQSYLSYRGWEDTTVRLGRQRITIGDHRFVGNVGWRQNEQTFDAVSVSSEALSDFDVFYSYVSNVNRIFGEKSPAGDANTGSHLLNVQRKFEEVGTLDVFAYALDYDDLDALSTTTYGASFGGTVDMDDIDLLYSLRVAQQEDAGDNPNDVDAGYYNAELGVTTSGVTFKVGGEVLEGSGDAGDAFQTPLATLHKFNGWADQFLATPDTGLEDIYLSVGGTVKGTSLLAVYHDFSSDSESIDYGTELDLRATRKLADDLVGGIKFADYSADDFSVDTTKAWIWFEWSF
ncbi:MAG: alginate export family protein [bacterium]|nr:alginate export family protein [bacterium]